VVARRTWLTDFVALRRIQQLLDHSKPDPSMFGALPPGALSVPASGKMLLNPTEAPTPVYAPGKSNFRAAHERDPVMCVCLSAWSGAWWETANSTRPKPVQHEAYGPDAGALRSHSS